MEPDRTLLILNEIRAELKALRAEVTFEFNEIHDRLRAEMTFEFSDQLHRIDERIDGLVTRIDALERRS
jgi:hypothetical protein